MNQNYFVTKQYLFTQVSQESIFEFYFGQSIDLASRYKSPLRNDTTPGCSFYYGQSGDLLFFDSKLGNMDCFKFIMLKNQCTFYDAIIRIKLDFQLIKTKNVEIIKEEKEPYLKKIAIKRKTFSKEELDYWQLPDLLIKEETLNRYGIFSVSDVWFNDIQKGYNLTNTFAYKQLNPYFFQIYKPFAPKEYKFRTNDGSYIYGWDRLKDCDEVIINKGPKDNFYALLAGYNSIGPIGEGFNIPAEKIEHLKQRYNKIYICYDNDEAGQKYTQKIISQYPFITPRPPLAGKDYTDMITLRGIKWVKDNW